MITTNKGDVMKTGMEFIWEEEDGVHSLNAYRESNALVLEGIATIRRISRASSDTTLDIEVDGMPFGDCSGGVKGAKKEIERTLQLSD